MGDRQKWFYIERICELRREHGLTQQDVADVLGTSQTMVARYERGANELPVHHLISLSKLYNVTTDYILNMEKIRKRRK